MARNTIVTVSECRATIDKALDGQSVAEEQTQRVGKFLAALRTMVNKAEKEGKDVSNTGDLESLENDFSTAFPKERKSGSRVNALAELGIVIE